MLQVKKFWKNVMSIIIAPSAHPIAIMRPPGCHASTVTSLSWLRDEFGMRAP